MSSTVTSRVKDAITFVLPRFVAECVPLLLATTLFQLELVRFCFFQGFLRPTGPQDALDWVASFLPWNVPQDPHSWLGRLTLWCCSIVCTASTVAVDVVLIIAGHDKDVSRLSLQQTSQEEPRDKEGESLQGQHQILHDGDGASTNISTVGEVETPTNRPLQRSELDLNSDRMTAKAVRFFPSSSDVVVPSVDGGDQLRMVCEHKVEERPGNPEPCWSLAPSLMTNSDLNTERAAATTANSRSPSRFSPATGPSFAEVAGSKRHPLAELDQEHTFTVDPLSLDKTFAQAVMALDEASSPPVSKDRGQSVLARSQAVKVSEEGKEDDSKTFAQTAAQGTMGAKGGDLEDGEATKESADCPSVINPKASVTFAAAAAGDHNETTETRGVKRRSDKDSSVKTFAEPATVVPPTTATEESLESDPKTSATTTKDSHRLHCEASSPWSPVSNKVEPPSPGPSATGHESDEDLHSEHSDDSSESSERKNKNRGLKKTNRRNKNKKRREKSKMDKVATRCQLDLATTSFVAEEDNGEKSMEAKMGVAAAPSLPLTIAEQSSDGVHGRYSTAAAANVKPGHDLDAGKKTEAKSEQRRQQKFVTTAENGDMVVTTD